MYIFPNNRDTIRLKGGAIMGLNDILKALVETEDQMERMSIVEQNKEFLEGLTVTKTDDGGEWETKYNELKKKYIDTFFSGKEPEVTKTDEATDEDDCDTITVDDLLKNI